MKTPTTDDIKQLVIRGYVSNAKDSSRPYSESLEYWETWIGKHDWEVEQATRASLRKEMLKNPPHCSCCNKKRSKTIASFVAPVRKNSLQLLEYLGLIKGNKSEKQSP